MFLIRNGKESLHQKRRLVFDVVPRNFLKTIKKNKRQISSALFSFIIVLTLFGQSIFPNQAQAESFDFKQTDWTTLDATAKATKATGVDLPWTKYYNKSSTDNTNFPITAGSSVTINPKSLSQTLPFDTQASTSIKVGESTYRDSQAGSESVSASTQTSTATGAFNTVPAGTNNTGQLVIDPGNTSRYKTISSLAPTYSQSTRVALNDCKKKSDVTWCATTGTTGDGSTVSCFVTAAGDPSSATSYTLSSNWNYPQPVSYKRYTTTNCTGSVIYNTTISNTNQVPVTGTGVIPGSQSFSVSAPLGWTNTGFRCWVTNAAGNPCLTSLPSGITENPPLTLINSNTFPYPNALFGYTSVAPSINISQTTVGQKTTIEYGVSIPVGMTYKSDSAKIVLNAGSSGTANFSAGYPVVDTVANKVKYKIDLYTTSGTVGVNYVEMTFQSAVSPAKTTVGPFSMTVPQNSSIDCGVAANCQINSNVASIPGAIVRFATSPTISGTTLTYSVYLENPSSTTNLSVTSVSFTIASSPPVTGTLIASPFDMGDPSVGPILTKLIWDETIPDPVKTKVKFQVRTSTDGTTWPNPFVGPDNTASSFFSSTNTDGSCTKTVATVTCSIPSTVAQASGPSTRFFQYQMILETTDSTITPTVDNVIARYVINSAPVVSAVSANQISIAGSTDLGKVNVAYTVTDAENTNLYGELFYDVGITLDNDISSVADQLNFTVPTGTDLASLGLPLEGVLLIENEEIYYTQRGTTYVAGHPSLSPPSPLKHGYGPLSGGINLTTSPLSHLKGTVAWVKAPNVSGNGAGDFSCTAGTSCAKSILWDVGRDFSGKYSNIQKIRVQVNDKESNRQSGGQDSGTFTLDTKAPYLGTMPFSLTQSASLINFSGYGWKSSSPSITFNLGTPVITDSGGITNDNASTFDTLTFCNSTLCGTFPGAQLLAGTASGWSPLPLPGWASTYNYTLAPQEISAQTINLVVVDNVGNKSTQYSQVVVYDKTPPPLPVASSFMAQDISGSLGRAAIYLKWDPIVWATQKDAYGRTDFKNFLIYRYDPTTTSCSSGGGTVGGLLFCYIATLPSPTGTNITSYVDENVVDGRTYTYRVITEDDIGNKWDITSASVPQSAALKVSVSGAPKITPQLTFLSKTAQIKYSDPITIYWETRDGSGAGLASDSQVAYIKSQTLPPDFASAATQGNSVPASVGTVQVDGSCACHKVTLIGLEAGTRYYFEMRSLYGSETGKLSGSSYYIDTMPAPPKLKATITNVLPLDAAVLSTPTSATITWDTKDATSPTLPMSTNGYVDYFGPGESTARSVGEETSSPSHSIMLSGLTSDTSYTYTIRSKPTNGDAEVTTFPSPPGTRSFKTKAVTADTDPPQVTNVQVRSNTGTGAQICWDTPNELSGASSIVEIWTGPSDHMVAQTPGYIQYNHCVTLNTLKPLTNYTFKAISYDFGSPPNRGESAEIPLTTSIASTIPNPAIANLRNDFPSPNSIVIYWDTISATDATKSVDTDSRVDIGSASPTSFELTPVYSPTLLSNHVITVTGLPSDKHQYYYRVKSTNANKVSTPDDATAYTCKDISGASIVCSFTTPLSPEPAPKIVTTGTNKIQVVVTADVANVTNTATIIWHTDKPGNSLVEFGSEFVDKPDGSRVPKYERGFVGNVNAYDTTHVIELPRDLVENATYYFRVRTVDKFKQIVQHPPENVDPSASYPPCDIDPIDNPNRYNCLNPSFKTAVSAFTRAQEVNDPIEITGVGAVSVTDTTATIDWFTNRAADSQVEFGPSTTYGCLGGICPLGEKYKVTNANGTVTTNLRALTRTHSVTITGLTPSTTKNPSKYYYKVSSIDMADRPKTETKNAAGENLSFTMSEGTGKFTEAQYKSIQEQLDALSIKLQSVNSQLANNLNQQAAIERQLQQTNLTQAQIDDLQRQLAELKSQAAQLQQIQASIVAEKAQLEKDLKAQKEQSIDQTPPVITDIKVSDITPDSAVISWTTDEKASSLVKYGETKEYENLAGDYASLITEHSVKLENLNSGTEYHFIVISYDLAVNRAESEDAVFTTLGFKRTSDDKEKLQEAKKKLEKALGSNTKLNTQNIINLLAEFSEDQVSKLLNDLGIQLVSPPQFTGGDPIVETTQTSAKITWATNKESDSRIAYIQDKNFKKDAPNPYPTETGDAEKFVTKHKVNISDLQPGTLYHFQLRSREAAGRSAKSPDYLFKTKTVKPEFSKIKVIDATEHTVTLEWATNIPTKSIVTYGNVPKTKDERSQGDSQLVRQHSLTLIDLSPDTKYTATLRAEDEEGITTFSKPFAFATTRDTTPPEISQMKAELSLIPGKQNEVQAIISWRTNEPSTSRVLYDDTLSKNVEYHDASPEQKDLTTFHVVVLTKLRSATIYRFRAVSSDEAENLGQSKEFKILTPRKEESVLELIIKNFEDTFGFLKGK